MPNIRNNLQSKRKKNNLEKATTRESLKCTQASRKKSTLKHTKIMTTYLHAKCARNYTHTNLSCLDKIYIDDKKMDGNWAANLSTLEDSSATSPGGPTKSSRKTSPISSKGRLSTLQVNKQHKKKLKFGFWLTVWSNSHWTKQTSEKKIQISGSRCYQSQINSKNYWMRK